MFKIVLSDGMWWGLQYLYSEFRIPLVVLSPSIHKTGIIALLIISIYRINSNTKNLPFLVNFMVDSFCSTVKIKSNEFLLIEEEKKCMEEYFFVSCQKEKEQH